MPRRLALTGLLVWITMGAGSAYAKPTFWHPALPPTASVVVNASEVEAWRERLAGRVLVRVSSYNSGGGCGGMASRIAIHLAEDGRFAVETQSSVSIDAPGNGGSSAGTTRASGTWRIFATEAAVVLEARYANGAVETNRLQANGEQTYINGQRWFVVSP